MAQANPNAQNPSANALAMDRRAWVRYGTDGEMLCQAKRSLKEPGWMAKVHDVSVGGIGLLLHHRFRPGTPLVIELKSTSGSWIKVMPVRVMHATAVRAENGAWWLVGCAFASPLEEHEVQALLSR